MENKDLVERVNNLFNEIWPLVEKYILYSGRGKEDAIYDFIDEKKVDPRNVQQRESIQALFDLYPKAVEYVTLSELIRDFSYLEPEAEKAVKFQILAMKVLTRYAKRHIDEVISKLPN